MSEAFSYQQRSKSHLAGRACIPSALPCLGAFRRDSTRRTWLSGCTPGCATGPRRARLAFGLTREVLQPAHRSCRAIERRRASKRAVFAELTRLRHARRDRAEEPRWAYAGTLRPRLVSRVPRCSDETRRACKGVVGIDAARGELRGTRAISNVDPVRERRRELVAELAAVQLPESRREETRSVADVCVCGRGQQREAAACQTGVERVTAYIEAPFGALFPRSCVSFASSTVPPST
eukprot:6715742-Prymnesium_polylepis.1